MESQQSVNGQVYSMKYSYDLAGELTDETHPSGRVIHNRYGADGRLLSLSSRASSNRPFKSYAQNFTYDANGTPEDVQLGNMRWESIRFNSRFQPVQIGLGSSKGGSDVLGLSYDYGSVNNNGTVVTQSINVLASGTSAGLVASQSYVYDALLRLKSAREEVAGVETWKQAYQYDRFGNRQIDFANTNGSSSLETTQLRAFNPSYDLQSNRIVAGDGEHYAYDKAGNLVTDRDGARNEFDGENRLVRIFTAGNNSNIPDFTFDYDVAGHRVRKSVNSVATTFIYDGNQHLIAEYTSAGSSPSPGLRYVSLDALGTPRVITGSNGEVQARHDYLPFGEEMLTFSGRSNVAGYNAPDSVRQKFTGKERDVETGLDWSNTRYYSSTQGRFISPDLASPAETFNKYNRLTALPYADLSNPQTLNSYCYTANDPVNHTDITGHDGETIPYGQFLLRLDKSNPNDSPNVHIMDKKGNEINRVAFTIKDGKPDYDWEFPKTRNQFKAIKWLETRKKIPFRLPMNRTVQPAPEGPVDPEGEVREPEGAEPEAGGGMDGLELSVGILSWVLVGHQVYSMIHDASKFGYYFDLTGDVVIVDLKKMTQHWDEHRWIRFNNQLFMLKDGIFQAVPGSGCPGCFLDQSPEGTIHVAATASLRIPEPDDEGKHRAPPELPFSILTPLRGSESGTPWSLEKYLNARTNCL